MSTARTVSEQGQHLSDFDAGPETAGRARLASVRRLAALAIGLAIAAVGASGFLLLNGSLTAGSTAGPGRGEDLDRAVAAGLRSEAGAQSVGAHRGISGVVRVAPELAGRIEPQDVLIVFARSADAAAVPLARIRKRATHLPMTFFLDDSTSVNPARPLSGHDRVVIGARISRPGARAAGDLQGSLEAPSGAEGVVIVIDREVR